MKHVLLLAHVFCLALTNPVLAETTKVAVGQSLATAYQIHVSTTFSIENAIGLITVVENTESDLVQISASQTGATPVDVHYGEVGPGKYKIEVIYPNGGNFSARGGVQMTNIVGGSVVINGSGIFVDGKRISNDGPSSTSYDPVTLIVKIPAKFLASLKVTTTSGEIGVSGPFKTGDQDRKVILHSVSGDIECESFCSFGELSIQTTSGDVHASNIFAGHGLFKTVSGDMELEKTMGTNLQVNSISGDVKANKCAGNLSVRTVSGDLSIRDHQNGHVAAEAVSGDIKLANPDDSVTETAKSLSGSVRGKKKSGGASSPSPGNRSKDPFDF